MRCCWGQKRERDETRPKTDLGLSVSSLRFGAIGTLNEASGVDTSRQWAAPTHKSSASFLSQLPPSAAAWPIKQDENDSDARFIGARTRRIEPAPLFVRRVATGKFRLKKTQPVVWPNKLEHSTCPFYWHRNQNISSHRVQIYQKKNGIDDMGCGKMMCRSCGT